MNPLDNLIPEEEINVLKPALEVKAVAITALQYQEEAAVTRAINLAANVGQLSVRWTNTLLDTTKQLLETNGYAVVQRTDVAHPNTCYDIFWK